RASKHRRWLLKRHDRFAVTVEAVAGTDTGATARRAVVVRETHAVTHRELAPVVGVHALLDLVRTANRARGAQLVHPFGLVDRARRGPRRHALLLEESDGVLTQSTSVERGLEVEDLDVPESGLTRSVAHGAVERRHNGVVGPVRVAVPHAAAAHRLPG